MEFNQFNIQLNRIETYLTFELELIRVNQSCLECRITQVGCYGKVTV